jgi:hypothetical protein
MPSSRREFLILGAATASLPGVLRAGSPGPRAPNSDERVADDLARYVGFGIKASGSAGDTATGQWLEAELASAAFSVTRQSFEAPFFEATRATLACGDAVADLVPQAIVMPGSVTGPLVRVWPSTPPDRMTGAIALIELPYRRWTTATAPVVRETVNGALSAGASGAVIVTTGPTGEAIALNAPADRPLFARPTAILAPKDAGPFFRAAATRAPATLVLEGRGGMRSAFNIAGRLDRGARRWIVVSTPRSGWFTCAGERGPGIATWLSLARWGADALRDYNLLFACNSGHEYENLGSAHLIEELAPRPSITALWLHLGANVAARDWHDVLPPLRPLPGADTQRYLVVSPGLRDLAGSAFAGLPGLDAPYVPTDVNAGELLNIVAAGYPQYAAIFGAHRYHHTQQDDARVLVPGLVAPVISACQQLIRDLPA